MRNDSKVQKIKTESKTRCAAPDFRETKQKKLPQGSNPHTRETTGDDDREEEKGKPPHDRQTPRHPEEKCTLEKPRKAARARAQATHPPPQAVPTKQSPKGTFSTVV
jgi:hypothetical protein